MIVGIGIDILKLDRVSHHVISEQDSFLMRSFTAAERDEAEGHSSAQVYYSSRFAAKEAVYKALSSCGIEFRPGEIEVLNKESGCPYAGLKGKTAKALDSMLEKPYSIHVSISHDTEYVSAMALIETN